MTTLQAHPLRAGAKVFSGNPLIHLWEIRSGEVVRALCERVSTKNVDLAHDGVASCPDCLRRKEKWKPAPEPKTPAVQNSPMVQSMVQNVEIKQRLRGMGLWPVHVGPGAPDVWSDGHRHYCYTSDGGIHEVTQDQMAGWRK